MTTANIISFLSLSPTYFPGTKCGNLGDDYIVLLNAVLADSFSDQEQNQGMHSGLAQHCHYPFRLSGQCVS